MNKHDKDNSSTMADHVGELSYLSFKIRLNRDFTLLGRKRCHCHIIILGKYGHRSNYLEYLYIEMMKGVFGLSFGKDEEGVSGNCLLPIG